MQRFALLELMSPLKFSPILILKRWWIRRDEWIFKRTGIKERHIAASDETTSDMGVEAAKIAIERAGLD